MWPRGSLLVIPFIKWLVGDRSQLLIASIASSGGEGQQWWERGAVSIVAQAIWLKFCLQSQGYVLVDGFRDGVVPVARR